MHMPRQPMSAQSVGEVLVAVLRQDLAELAAWEPVARGGTDPEGVHQLRIGLRRMRVALICFRPALSRAASAPWLEELNWVGEQLAPARNLDVFIGEGLEVMNRALPLPGAERLAELAGQRREVAYGAVRALLEGERYQRFRREFRQWLDQAGWTQANPSPKQRACLAASVVPFARRRLDQLVRATLAAGLRAHQDPLVGLHPLRDQCKRLRYAAEIFIPLFAGMEPLIASARELQDRLGLMHDLTLTEDLLDEILADTQDQDLIHQAGALMGWRAHQYQEIQRGFGECWESFVHAKHPWWQSSALIH